MMTCLCALLLAMSPPAQKTPDSPGTSQDVIVIDGRRDPSKIPEAEKRDWQPKELVAVYGKHQDKKGTDSGIFSVAISASGDPPKTSPACT